MSAKRTIAALLDNACDGAEEVRFAQARQVVRHAWAREIIAKLKAPQDAVDKAWDKYFDEIEAEGSETNESEDPPPFPEQDVLDALLAQANAVREHDRWPRELYWGGI